MKQTKNILLFSSRLLLIAYWLLLIGSISSCKLNYSFTGASIPPEVKTVSIQYFPNNASIIKPTLSQSFTETLRDIFTSQTNLSLINKGGDLNFEGSITGYTVSPIAIQSNDAAALNRLTITVNVKFTNKKNEKQNFETYFSRFADYGSSQNLSAVEDQLIKDINTQLTQDIFNKSVTNW